MSTFTITRTETVRNGIELTRQEVIDLLVTNEAGTAEELATRDDAALLELLRDEHYAGGSLWEDVYERLESTGWADTIDIDTDIDLRETP